MATKKVSVSKIKTSKPKKYSIKFAKVKKVPFVKLK